MNISYFIKNNNFKILAVYPFDDSVFTQGLAFNGSVLFVSSGKYGKSFIGKVDLENGTIFDKFKFDEHFFAEGITLIDERIIIATWKENTLLELNKERYLIDNVNEIDINGESWGLTNSNKIIYMSDGSSHIYKFNINFPNKSNYINVSLNNEPLNLINEIEYANGFIYANVWYSDQIYKIDITNGKVVAVYDLENLGNRFNIPELTDNNYGVLNGIAHISNNLFYITGKNWPVILKIKLE